MISGNNIIALVTGGVLTGSETLEADLTSGFTTAVEQAMAARLAALKVDGAAVFKTAEVWKYQLIANQGGTEAFDKYAPFAFVKYEPSADFSREGDGDLCQKLRFSIGFGTRSKEAGIARTGDANHIGISLIRDLVIDLFDSWHPGEGFVCDSFYFDGDEIQIDSPNRHAMIIYFKANLF